MLSLWQAGVAAVRGAAAIRAALPDLAEPPTRMIAVGKAACDMAAPVLDQWPDLPALLVTKHGHETALPGAPRIIGAGHPIPDAASLDAGAALAEAVAAGAADDHLLMLVSGGASAVAELLPAGMTLDAWQAETEALVASGADIHAINQRRREVSQIKGGKLLAGFGGARVTTLAISDVEGDALNVIGSGIGAAPEDAPFVFRAQIVASNAIARAAAEAAAGGQRIAANEECLYGDVTELAPALAKRLRGGAAGLYIFGGEPTVKLPDSPGRGGRNQLLALLLAREIAGRSDIEILVAGTDGTDGPTQDAGAWVDGDTWEARALDYIGRADSGTFLAERNALITTGPTGTNVMDLMIARKT
ncbi:DUF4147 domain-containing protein [Aliishimia ponticola]|uniref:DUF4147 domain-containing protein n=1 Tax=Aliishimia ponticola TaxID=2499833 RepID=A0A4S4NAC3_9RHOB|nr:DUF4147 domain-containing protein [Aliishimia ponticola]